MEVAASQSSITQRRQYPGRETPLSFARPLLPPLRCHRDFGWIVYFSQFVVRSSFALSETPVCPVLRVLCPARLTAVWSPHRTRICDAHPCPCVTRFPFVSAFLFTHSCLPHRFMSCLPVLCCLAFSFTLIPQAPPGAGKARSRPRLRTTTACATSPPATCCAPQSPPRPPTACVPNRRWSPARWCPTTLWWASSRRPSRRRSAGTASSSTVSHEPCLR